MEETVVRKKLFPAIAGILMIASLTACGTDPEILQFKTDMEEFCTSIAGINESINNIDAEVGTH